jgi:hypothetical protein
MGFKYNIVLYFLGDNMSIAEKRKLRSEDFLQSHQIPIYSDLPCIIDETNGSIRTAQDIARQAIIMMTPPFHDKQSCMKWWKKEHLDQYLFKEYQMAAIDNKPKWYMGIREDNLIFVYKLL